MLAWDTSRRASTPDWRTLRSGRVPPSPSSSTVSSGFHTARSGSVFSTSASGSSASLTTGVGLAHAISVLDGSSGLGAATHQATTGAPVAAAGTDLDAVTQRLLQAKRSASQASATSQTAVQQSGTGSYLPTASSTTTPATANATLPRRCQRAGCESPAYLIQGNGVCTFCNRRDLDERRRNSHSSTDSELQSSLASSLLSQEDAEEGEGGGEGQAETNVAVE